jgi:23S rRNA (guanosine2251-2'-O)-methyltransferase
MRKLKNEELNRLSVPAFKDAEKLPIVIVLDNVRSLHNIGSVFRTADAFRIETICLCGITASPPHREIHKTALGATESVNWKYYPTSLSALEELRSENFIIVSLEQAENSLFLHDFMPESGKKYAFIFGNEVTGVGEELIEKSDMLIEIPQFGTKHSLNISVSVGILVWDYFSKIRKG